MKKFFRIYKNKYMIRPTVNQTFIRCILVILIGLLWERFLDNGSRGFPFILQILGVVFVLLAWFHYLGLDGIHVLPQKREDADQPPKKRFRLGDMIDFVGENVNPMEDLSRDERSACKLLANLITGILFLVIGSAAAIL